MECGFGQVTQYLHRALQQRPVYVQPDVRGWFIAMVTLVLSCWCFGWVRSARETA